MAVVGSGIAAQQLSPTDVGLQLLENAAATAAALIAIILTLGPVSGAHINPVVTVAARMFGEIGSRDAAAYIASQLAGGVAGVALANLMFGEPAAAWSTTSRTGRGLWLAEGVATFGLLLVVFGLVRSRRSSAVPIAVGAHIGGAYFFTSSTSFANPAATMARSLTDTFAGIDPSSVPWFLVAEGVGAAIAFVVIPFLYPPRFTVRSPPVPPSATRPC